MITEDSDQLHGIFGHKYDFSDVFPKEPNQIYDTQIDQLRKVAYNTDNDRKGVTANILNLLAKLLNKYSSPSPIWKYIENTPFTNLIQQYNNGYDHISEWKPYVTKTEIEGDYKIKFEPNKYNYTFFNTRDFSKHSNNNRNVQTIGHFFTIIWYSDSWNNLHIWEFDPIKNSTTKNMLYTDTICKMFSKFSVAGGSVKEGGYVNEGGIAKTFVQVNATSCALCCLVFIYNMQRAIGYFDRDEVIGPLLHDKLKTE